MGSLEALRLRSALLQSIRAFFFRRGYLEVDTPIRQPVLIPERHIRPFASDGWWLQASPELAMKRLLARGCHKIFQVCHCFRRDEAGHLHLPEFTMLEWYHCGWDYRELMTECEELVRAVAASTSWPAVASTGAGEILRRGERVIDLGAPWGRLTVAEACQRHGGTPAEDLLAADSFDSWLVEHAEPCLGWDKPQFLLDYPIRLGSLARPSPQNPAVAERFELYLAAVELINGFSELNDPREQRQRFLEELEAMAQETAMALPRRFLGDLEDMPPAAGAALGVDRLLMLLMGAESVQATVAFTPEEL